MQYGEVETVIGSFYVSLFALHQSFEEATNCILQHVDPSITLDINMLLMTYFIKYKSMQHLSYKLVGKRLSYKSHSQSRKY